VEDQIDQVHARTHQPFLMRIYKTSSMTDHSHTVPFPVLISISLAVAMHLNAELLARREAGRRRSSHHPLPIEAGVDGMLWSETAPRAGGHLCVTGAYVPRSVEPFL
jgi:hypothetical protein